MRLIVIGSMVLLFFSCSEKTPIRIGFVAGLTGRVADLGVAGRNGAMLAVEQKNRTGGIKGRPIELIVRDDQQDPETAKQVVADLIDLKVSAIIGPMTSSMAMAMVPSANASGVLLISPTVTTTQLEGKDDNFIRIVSTVRGYASKIAQYHFEKKGFRKAVAIYDVSNQSYTRAWFDIFKRVFESLGGHVVSVRTFRSGDDTSFFETTRDLLTANPDMVLILANAVDAALITHQVRKLDSHIAIAMSEWASTERYIELGGAAAEGVYVTQFVNRNDPSEGYQAFRKRYFQRFGQAPGFAGLSGFDAAAVLMDALEKQKVGQSLKDTFITRKKFKCTQQFISIDPYGDADRRTFVATIRNGRYHTIE